ncbi:putative glutamine ABC transporter permease protein GlnM [bacterium YEK0313]|nr:putative glutamine ABC transporter permease protein GlnM [bacterium YEK0313]
MGYQWNFFIIQQYAHLFVKGLGFTLAFTVVTIVAGGVLGLVLGLARLSQSRFVNWPLIAVIELFRCTPLLVLIIWFYYAMPVLTGVQLSAVVAGGLVLTLYTAAFYAEIFRGGVASIETGQWDAARALGLTWIGLMRLVILPQAVRRMIPPLMNQSVLQLKNTSLVSVIAVPDLLYQGELITAETYRPLEVYTVVAMLYFAVLLPLTLYAQRLEQRLAAPGR